MKKMSVYKLLVDFNSDREKPELVSLVRQVLYDFSYHDLSSKYKDYKKVQKAIFNFFYFGEFSEVWNDETKKHLKDIITDYSVAQLEAEIDTTKIKKLKEKINDLPSWKDFYKTFHANWKEIFTEHGEYIDQVKKPVEYIVVYEAPPYVKNEDVKKSYFLKSDSGAYATTIKNCFNNGKFPIKDVLKGNNIGYFDLIMAQVPLSTNIRGLWGRHSNWNVGGKQLPVVLLELGVAHMILKGIEFDRPIFALGPPAKTSASIFEYYSDKLFRVWKKKTEMEELRLEHIVFEEPNRDDYELVFSSDLSILNSTATHKKWGEQGKGEIFPLYKSSVISGANFLSELLMKNAFDRFSK